MEHSPGNRLVSPSQEAFHDTAKADYSPTAHQLSSAWDVWTSKVVLEAVSQQLACNAVSREKPLIDGGSFLIVTRGHSQVVCVPSLAALGFDISELFGFQTIRDL